MDSENVWQQSGGSDDALNKLLQQSDFNNLHSKLPLNKLKKNLLIGITWAALITVAYIVLLFFVQLWQVYITLSVLIFFNIWIAIDTWKLYKNISVDITVANGFQRWWSLQQRASLFVYPIALTGGFILGGFLGSNKAVESFLYNSKMLSILGIIILIVMPVCYYGAKWMFNYAYGKHLKKIKMFIDELG